MRKVITGLVFISLLATPMIALAQEGEGEAGIEAPEWGDVEIMDVLERITNWLFVILIAVAAIAIMVAAYLFVTAAGDPDKTKKARDFVLYALIGVIVAFVAKGLVTLIETIVTG